MAFFEWDEKKYSVGIREMDQQHKQLLVLLNRLYESMYRITSYNVCYTKLLRLLICTGEARPPSVNSR